MNESHAFDTIALNVGRVCIIWSALDNVCYNIAERCAIMIDPMLHDKRAREMIRIALVNMEQRELFAAVKAYAFRADVPDRFYDRLEKHLNYIDNTLRPLRNRYVHDSWGFDGEAHMRWQRGSKVVRKQARQRELLIGQTHIYESDEHITEFVNDLAEALEELRDLSLEIREHTRQRVQNLGLRERLALACRNSFRREKPEQGKR